MRFFRAIGLAGCCILVVPGMLAAAPTKSRPLIVTARQFECLRKFADKLPIGKRGAIVDFGQCPPNVEDGFFPLTPSQTKRLFTPEDMDCLIKAGRRGAGIAFRRPGGAVALYLDPCGAK